MEQLFLKIFSENGLIAWLFLLMLYWIYRAVIFLWSKAIHTYEDNLKLQREAQERKDLEFLRSVWEMSQIIKKWDDEHEIAHGILWSKIDKVHENVEQIIKYQTKWK